MTAHVTLAGASSLTVSRARIGCLQAAADAVPTYLCKRYATYFNPDVLMQSVRRI